MNILEIDILIKNIPSREQLLNDKYIVSYPSFVSYFDTLDQITHHDLLRGLGFAYSWMPRTLSVDTSQIQLFSQSLNRLKGSSINKEEIKVFDLATQFTAGSIVAASKLLHFIFPTRFPIYDSHVYKYCWDDEKAYYYKIKSSEKYKLYRNSVLTLSKKQEVKILSAAVTDAVGYDVSDVRAIEFSIFYSSKAKFKRG